jgi:signal transduction histidine kinase
MVKRLVGGIGRLSSVRPPLAWLALGFSGASILLGILRLRALAAATSFTSDQRVSLAIGLWGSLALSLLIFLVSSRRAFRILAALRIALFLGLVAEFDPGPGVGLVFLVAILLEVSIYERFSLNLGISFAVVAGYAVMRYLGAAGGFVISKAAFETALVRDVDTVLYGTIFAFVACMLLAYRERTIQQGEEIQRLDRAVAKLSEANLGYQQYASGAEQQSMMEERKRITREIHDVIGYSMTNIIMMMEAVIDMMRRDPGKVEGLVNLARQNAEEGLDEIRHALHLLRAQEQPPATSLDAIVRLARIFQIATGVHVALELGNVPSTLEGPIEETLYHLVQEALTNSFRHGKATLVKIMMWMTEQQLIVNIWDNGVGAGSFSEGIGLAGMRERLARLNGTFGVRDVADGFQVTAEIPLPEPAGRP